MTVRNRQLIFFVALAAALVMLLTLGGIAFAGSQAPNTACVDGYVINHRELAVDGTRTTPSLFVEAISANATVTTTVGSDGYFKFAELPVGDWNFRMQLPEGWDGIVPLAERGGLAETGLTPIVEKDGCHRVVFKIRRLFEVIVIKWEEGLDGSVAPGMDWVIHATPVNDPFVKAQTDTTSDDGSVGFTLTAGHWVISEVVKPGWKPITPSRVTLDLDQYASIGARDPVVFKNLKPPCYSAIVVEKLGFGTDADGNEVLLGPLAGWQVTVSRADGAMAPVTKVTDGSGKATFANLPPGVYKIKEHLQVGWETMDANPQTVVHMDCETSTVRFSNKETKGDLRIYGKKLFKAWTPPYQGHLVGLSGWTITATLVGTEMYTTTVTNALGDYLFPEAQLKEAGLAFPGATIEVCEEDRDNWIHVTPKCVRVHFPYPLPPDYAGVEVNFTNIQDPPVAGSTSGGSCRTSHLIARGETLARIAGRYGVSMSALVRLNGIKNPDVIYAGQTLCIP